MPAEADEFGLDEDPFARPTVIPEVVPTEDYLMGNYKTPPPPPMHGEFDDKPSAVIRKGSLEPDPHFGAAELDLHDLDATPFTPPQAQAPSKAQASSIPSRKKVDPISFRMPSATPTQGKANRPATRSDEVDAWGGGSRVSAPANPAFDEDLFDLSVDPGAQELIPVGDDLNLELDSLRDPKIAPAPASPRSSPSRENEPNTAPYPLDPPGHHDPSSRHYTPGHLRAPTSSEPDTLNGLPDFLEEADPFAKPISSSPPRLPPSSSSPPRLSPSSAPAPSPGPPNPLREMRDKFALGDFSGALKIAEGLLEKDASHAEAGRYAENCRERLRGMYEAKLGSLRKTPRIALPPDQVRWLSLDHKAGFILSCVDGYSTIEEILDVSGMPTFDALRILCDLLQQRVIAL